MDNKEILDSDVSRAGNKETVISEGKFVFLCFITFGLYEVWWAYKSWRYFKQRERSDINPVARTILGIFFLHSLFERIKKLANSKGYKADYNSAALFIAFFILNVLGRLPPPFWLIAIFSFVPLVPPFRALRFAQMNEEVPYPEQENFNSRQIVLIVLGLIFWLLVVVGLFSVDPSTYQ
jgi:hypothetical protein